MRVAELWVRLGIALERTRPAHPQENGQHERMHRTLKQVNRQGQLYISGVGGFALPTGLGGEHGGIREEDDGCWPVNFCGLDLGYGGPTRKSFDPIGPPPL